MTDELARLLGLHGHHARLVLTILLILLAAGGILVYRSVARARRHERPADAGPGLVAPGRAEIRDRLREEARRLRSDAPELRAERAYRLGLIASLRAARSWLRRAGDARPRGLAALDPLPPEERITVATRVGDALFEFGLAGPAEGWYRRALLEAERSFDRTAALHAASRLSLLRYQAGDLDEAEEWLRPLAGALRGGGSRAELASCETTLGLIRRAKGETGAARGAFRRALDLYRELGDGAGQGMAFAELGATFEREGDSYGALESWAQAISRYRMVGMDREADALQTRSDRIAHRLEGRSTERA